MDIRDRYSTRKKYLINITGYKILQKINTGGFGTVYMIQDKEGDTKYAAKTIIGDTYDEQSKKMINREIGILIRLQHPTIVQFVGYSLKDFNGNDNVTLIMALAEKGSLATILQDVQRGFADTKYDNTIRQKILIGIARGMMYLHKNHVIHRDLKPGNILLDNNYHPLITDFGVSKVYSQDQSHKQTEAYGTSIYMAPEIVRGDPYNGKADVYSFGILMYEVVTDTLPYPLFQNKKMSLFDFNNKIVKDNYRPEFNTPIKKSIKKLIEDCWSDDPDLRPTFDEIFNKLAFNMDENVYDIFEDDDEFKFYLENVDVDEILSYSYEISDDERRSDVKISDKEVIEMRNQISIQKNLITSMKTESDASKEKIKSMSLLIDEQNKTIEALKKENREQKKINSDVLRRLDLLEGGSSVSLLPPKTDEPEKIDEEALADEQQQQQEKHEMQIIEINKKDGFEGIVNYLTEKTGGNIHDNGTIEVTSNSIGNNNHPRYLLNNKNNDSYMAEGGETDFWVCFDFKDMEVEISSYIIKSYRCETGHLKSWTLEVSTDGIQWTKIDERSDCEELSTAYETASFDARPICGRFCRIQHRGEFWGYKYTTCPGFNQIDFYGRLKIPINK